MITKLETLQKKVKCACCEIKMVPGRQVLVEYNDKGKIKNYYCREECLKLNNAGGSTYGKTRSTTPPHQNHENAADA